MNIGVKGVFKTLDSDSDFIVSLAVKNYLA